MPLLGGLHLGLLTLIAGVTFGLCLLARRRPVALHAVRLALGCLLAANELIWWWWRYSHEGIHLTNLPLQLCDLSVWLAVAACLAAAPKVVEFAYFTGLAGGGMALLTPDLWSPWPTYPAIYFFAAHGLTVASVTMLAFAGTAPFRRASLWRSYALLLGFAALVGLLNWLAGSNYMYLCRKPVHPSLLDQFGPWPWYLVPAGGLGLVIFWLLWLPVRSR